MTQQFLYHRNICAFIYQMCGKAMPQTMDTSRLYYSRFVFSRLYYLLKASGAVVISLCYTPEKIAFLVWLTLQSIFTLLNGLPINRKNKYLPSACSTILPLFVCSQCSFFKATFLLFASYLLRVCFASASAGSEQDRKKTRTRPGRDRENVFLAVHYLI